MAIEDRTPELEAAIERKADLEGISFEMAERAILSLRVESSSMGSKDRLPGISIARGPNRRGGRSYPEKSGRDVSREIANQEPIPEGAGEKGPAYEAYRRARRDL